MVSSIEDVSLAILDSFWIGDLESMPKEEAKWCEVWLRYEGVSNEENYNNNKKNSVENLISCCENIGILIGENEIVFPERIIKLIYANKAQLQSLLSSCDYIAEFRRSPEKINFFNSMSGVEQQEWVDDLIDRTSFIDSKVTVCVLDTGLASKHPLLSPAILSENSIQAVDSSWGSYDHDGHGTEMAGVALYNDLKEKFVSNDPIMINHKIESVKILPTHGENAKELYGAITENAVLLAEIENPDASRVLCMAITTSEYNTDDGSPTSWSAAIDSLTSGAEGNGNRRLFLISGGNVHPLELMNSPYPDINTIRGVENPGQSWNAITVGAYCDSVEIDSADFSEYIPVADVGELSPYSSTSLSWKKDWPIKPEIVLDGGNMITNGFDYDICEDLSTLTTNRDFLNKPLSTIWGTSSATAQASWMASQLYNEYPNIWPETVRALLIHSASWTPKMIEQFCKEDKKSKGRRQLLRTCGYGIPNLQKAIECANNSVNLIIQEKIQPFTKKSMNEMHIHEIPWPKEVLKSLGEIDAKIKVTLSYFIEPGPGEIGWKNRYRYPSAGLRFDVINSNETLDDFKKRVNTKMRGEDPKDNGDGSSRNWHLGTNNRDVGSIHSDFCSVSAIDLCDANYIAVYPVIGWWRERDYLKKYNQKMNYSLVVSIETPETNIDLYTPIVTQIKQEITVDITT
ncbi:serine protease [Enterococcus ratti]|uniref:Serine protease n=2 Tax=Enterococcus ratti TaxID=150033 RepID=A0A1L8WRA9_9ENTE|nr:serine protease [Enterococcus ratti]